MIRELWEQGLLNKEIAEKSGKSQQDVYRILSALGLKRNHTPKTQLLNQIGPSLIDAGLIDKDIAEIVGCTGVYVGRWRKKRSIRLNSKGKISQILDKFGFLLHKEGLTDKQIAIKLNLKTKSVFSWRSRRGLVANARAGSVDWRALCKTKIANGIKTLEVYNKHLSAKESAALLGICVNTWNDRKRRLNKEVLSCGDDLEDNHPGRKTKAQT